MSIQKSYGFDTAGERVTGFKPYYLPASSLVTISDSPGRVIMETTSSPVDTPERFTFAISPLRDIYKATDIAIANRPYSSRGASILCKSDGFITLTDSAIADFLKIIPVSIRTVLEVPLLGRYIAANDVLAMLSRHAGMLLPGDTAETSMSARLNELIRGVLKPT